MRNLYIIKKQKNTRYQPNIKREIEDIILITLLAILAKYNEWTKIKSFTQKKKEWLKQYLELPNGIPSHETIQMLIPILNSITLYYDSINYLINKITTSKTKNILSMDEKTTNGSSKNTRINKDKDVVNTMFFFK